MNPLISVIVPVYKVEPYLDRCIQSIVNQTYQNLEIILVDDGSPDNCPSMCDTWSKKDSRIKVVHKKNGGLSDARNVGMSIASGELIGFVDSDDWISSDMYQLLYSHMIESNSDISACGVEMLWENGAPSRMLTQAGNSILTQKEALQAIIEESWLKQPVWYKLYKSSLIQNLAFPIGKYHEDVFWSYQAIARAERVCVFDTPLYFYLQHPTSIMGQGFSEKRIDGLDAKAQRLLFFRQYYPDLVPIAEKELWLFSIYLMQQALRFHASPHIIKRIQGFITGLHLQAPLSAKEHIWLFLSNLSFIGTCRLRNLLKIGL